MSAEDLGKRLLAEVDECGLDEILNTIRLADDSPKSHFGFLHLDALLQCAIEGKNTSSKAQASAPCVELMSLASAGGKTYLLYHIAAIAVLPTHLGGQQAAVVIIDADGRFSVSRLAQQLRRLTISHTKEDFLDEEAIENMLVDALKHVHIFKPQSLSSAVATLQSLPTYLFDPNRHYSFDRHIKFVALDSASAFYWQSRSDAEDAALLASTTSAKQPLQSSGYVQLAAGLKNASQMLSCPTIFTSRDTGPSKTTSNFEPDAHSFRPSLPPPWQTLPTLRLTVQGAAVRKLPVEITVEDAMRECEIRQKVVEQGKFEVLVNEWGVEDKVLQSMRMKGALFEMFITKDGVVIGDGPE